MIKLYINDPNGNEQFVLTSTVFFFHSEKSRVGGRNFETLNDGFKILLRTWTIFCGGVFKMIYTVEVRVKVKVS